jgi:hypothetical protein
MLKFSCALQRAHVPMLEPYVMPPCLGLARGDHVSWPIMENMISIMMMINMSTYGSPTTPLIHLYNYRSIKAHHIQTTQCMGDGKPMSP